MQLFLTYFLQSREQLPKTVFSSEPITPMVHCHERDYICGWSRSIITQIDVTTSAGQANRIFTELSLAQGVLRIRLIEAKKLMKMDVGLLGMGKSDPYAIIVSTRKGRFS